MKRALSILLAVLMLASLCGSMAFADDDVVEEEAVATGEYVEPETEAFEAADAYVEEYTEEDEGSFEAADAYTPDDIDALLPLDPEDPQIGDFVIDRILVNGEYVDKLPTKHEAEALVWLKEYLGEDETGEPMYGNPEKYLVIVPHIWSDWVVVYDDKASCEEDGWQHLERTCVGDGNQGWHKGCGKVEKTEKTFVPRTEHYFVQDKTYTDPNSGDDRAIVKKPTCKEDGKGHWVCKNCGAPAPAKFWNPNAWNPDPEIIGNWEDGDYIIWRKDILGNRYDPTAGIEIDPLYHDFGEWTVVKPAHCLEPGTEAHYCNLCKFQQTRDIPAFAHGGEEGFDYTEGFCFIDEWPDDMVFKSILRVDCWHYVEVWECSNPACHTTVDKNGKPVDTLKDSQFTLYVYNYDDGVVFFETLLKNVPVPAATMEDEGYADDTVFLYVEDYAKPFNNNTEKYPHHRFDTEWVLDTLPQCCVPGRWTRVCAECDFNDHKPEPALEPMYGDEMHTDVFVADTDDDGELEDVYVHWVCCTRKACQEDYFGFGYHEIEALPWFDKVTDDVTNPLFFTQANNSNPQVFVVDHDWSEWTCYVQPVEGVTLGHWTRTCRYMDPAHLPDGTKCDDCVHPCLENEEFVGTQAEFDAMISHPVLTSGLIPEIVDGVVVYKLYEMGLFQDDVTGIVTTICEGVVADYYVKDGIWQKEEMGAILVDDVFYFLANGKVQKVNQLCLYEDEWFYVENGVINTEKNGLVDYDGGTFMLGAGRIQREVSGLWENSTKIGGDGRWYYLAMGEVQKDYTGLVEYDGEWFYVEHGMLVPFNGEVEYDGHTFLVVNGQMVAQVA
jgi:hypothetical protein